LERRVARLADVTLGASTDLVARALAAGGRDVRPGAVAAPVLPPPSRPAAEVRDELGVAEGQPLLLSVGRLHPQKGYDVLIDAAARWRGRTPSPVVAVAGTGPVYLGLAAHASAARAPVLLLGYRDDVSDLLGAADLAVVTSIWEARQLFAQEALRAGVPLVATSVGGLPELVGEAAVLVPPKDVDAVDTPTLWQLAQNGAVGALSVTSAHTPTCPVDGWLSLGAGNFALWSDDEVVNPDCPTKTPDIRSPDGIGAFLPDVDPKVNGV